MSGVDQNTTFDELEIPFPLFTAPMREATEYRAAGQCGVCNVQSAHTFQVHSDRCCYSCLRRGNASFPKYTVIGIVLDDENLEAIGMSDAEIRRYGFDDLGPHPLEPNASDWHSVRTAPGLLTELLKTPNFNCWSDCTWLFCCQQPMIYRGIWKAKQFVHHAGDMGVELFFNSVMVDEWDRIPNPNPSAKWQHDALDGCGGPYVFQCSICHAFKANNDNP